MSSNSELFDQEAAKWDDKPGRRELGLALAAAIRERLTLDESTSLMDFGCGTGLVLLPLAEGIAQATGVDTSAEMLARVREKATSLGWTHVDTLQVDVSKESLPRDKYDAVITSMALHHVDALPEALCQLSQALRPGGEMILIDLMPEDGSFHGEDAQGVYHNGFDPEELAQTLATHGMVDIQHEAFHTLSKDRGDFPIFLLKATRKPS